LSAIINIIPKPVEVEFKNDVFQLSKETVILRDVECEKLADQLREVIFDFHHLKLSMNSIKKKNSANSIILKIIPESLHSEEAYRLYVNTKNVEIHSSNLKGIFYGIQSLKQLLFQGIKIPCLTMNDYPRFSWRGFMLDEARHFFGIEEVKKILDVMALLKFNIFHWHLTDDQGWRIEIKKYPLLMEISSKRNGTSTDKRKLMSDLQKDKSKIDLVPVSGFYTQDEIKEIINYAKERFITIIPEIDFPGHVQAVLAAYPELSCSGGPFEVSKNFGVHKDVFCIGKEEVFTFSKNVFKEIMELFPSSIIHTGGDEVPIRRYKKCSHCQSRMKKEGLNNEKQLQSYYTSKIGEYLEENGHILMGWNEILNEHLCEKAICQFWAGDFNLTIDHIKKGRKTIMSDMRYVYLNYPYKLTSLRKTYDYEPIPDELINYNKANILGIEACLWSEYVKNVEILEYQIFPRLIAIAEIGWTLKENKNIKFFEQRLQTFLRILEYQNINYAENEDIQIQF